MHSTNMGQLMSLLCSQLSTEKIPQILQVLPALPYHQPHLAPISFALVCSSQTNLLIPSETANIVLSLRACLPFPLPRMLVSQISTGLSPCFQHQ